jgi:hypothetical protein
MSINKVILPNLEKVKDMYNANPTSFIKRYKKIESFMGDIESIMWVESKLEDHYERDVKK